ncbi:MAG: YkgJ family cysteine cluster protein [Deltaproteobacteria bacterium]|nr:YkgJ family cysteine cluster protein [Deltaproteobacteria bacterium]
MDGINPCLECGACCAFYRASFYWAEAGEDDISVPLEMVQKFDAFRYVMRGTNGNDPRCCALSGVIGGSVFCTIYERRSSVCRDFAPSWMNGVHNPLCDKARAAWGLAPLTPDIWQGPHLPKAA